MKAKVDKKLLPMKAHYFFFNAGTAPVVPFLTTLARQLGYSTVVVGIIYTFLPIIGMIAKPVFGFIADRYNRHRMLFLLAQVLTAISFFSITFVPSVTQPNIEFHCHNGVSDLRICQKSNQNIGDNLIKHYGNQTLTCQLYCNVEPFMRNIICTDWLNESIDQCNLNETYFNLSIPLNMENIISERDCTFFSMLRNHGRMNERNITMNCPKEKQYFNATCVIDCNTDYFNNQLTEVTPKISDNKVIHLYQFWLFFLLLILSWIGMAVVVSIGDAVCFSLLGDRHHRFGKQRLCGSLGWGIFSVIAGVVVDQVSGDSVKKDYTIVFCMSVCLLCIDVYASSKIKHTQTRLSPNILKDVSKMFLNLQCVIFFLWCIFIGLCTALVWNFLFLYLEDLNDIYGSASSIKTLQGLVMGVQCFGGEIPFFFISGWLLKKIGHVNAMSMVLLGFGVRFLLYFILKNPWYILPIELLNGVTYGIFYTTMASYANILAPPGNEATIQGLVGAIFEGVGVSLGSLIGGILFDVVGGSSTYAIFGSCSLALFVIHVCLQFFLKRNADPNKMVTRNGTVAYFAPNDASHMLEDKDYYCSSNINT